MKHLKLIVPFVAFLLSALNMKAQNPYVAEMISRVNIDSLMHHVEEISGYVPVVIDGNTDTIKSRNKFQPGNDKAFRFIAQELRSYGLEPDSGLFGTRGKNIWAIQQGAVYPNQYYIICGHYDAMPTGSIAPAADDDGSGVGAVLEAARVLSDYLFEYSIIYAFWDEEEYSLTGSNKFATDAQTNGMQILGVLNMDAIAWDGNNDSVARVHVKPIANSENIGDTVFMMNTRYHIGLDLQLNNPGATYSDHASFWNKNFSALLIIQDWDNDPNPHYHQVSDSITYFNVPFYHKMARLSISSVATLAIPLGYLGIDENKPNMEFSVYPNPVDHYLNIVAKDKNAITQAEVFSLSGTKMISVTPLNGGIELDGLSPGIYILRLTATSGASYIKFIKQ